MKTIKYFAPLILLVAIAGSPLAAPAANPFAGTWAGTLTHANGTFPLTEVLTLTISERGRVESNYRGVSLRGQISDDGSVSVGGFISGRIHIWRVTIKYTVQIEGVVAIDEIGHMVGVVELQEYWDWPSGLSGSSELVVLDLAPQG